MLEIGTYVVLLFDISSNLGCSLAQALVLHVTIVKMPLTVSNLL